MSGFPRRGGASGTVTSVDGQVGPAVDLTGVYQALKDGSPEPIPTTTIGVGTTFTPTLANGNHVQATATGIPAAIAMPVVSGGKRRTWFLDLSGGFEPTAWTNVTWIGAKTTAGAFEQYMFQTVDDGASWRGYHLTAQFSVTNFFTAKSIAAAGVPTPTGTDLNIFVDSADGILKAKDANAQLFHCMLRVATTAPTNTAVLFADVS